MNLYPDEPIFILRAADAMAPWAILDWARSVVQSPDASKPQFDQAAQGYQVAMAMLEWQKLNKDKVKLPDKF